MGSPFQNYFWIAMTFNLSSLLYSRLVTGFLICWRPKPGLPQRGSTLGKRLTLVHGDLALRKPTINFRIWQVCWLPQVGKNTHTQKSVSCHSQHIGIWTNRGIQHTNFLRTANDRILQHYPDCHRLGDSTVSETGFTYAVLWEKNHIPKWGLQNSQASCGLSLPTFITTLSL